MRYYILVKRKASKKWEGEIPARKGLSKNYIDKIARISIRKGWQFKVISESALNRHYLSRMRISRSKRTKSISKTKSRTQPRKRRTQPRKVRKRAIRTKRRRK